MGDSLEEHHPIILIVDDNPAIRDMVTWAVGLEGYEAAEAADGREALAWIDKVVHEKKYPSIILLDLAMPEMDGATFLKQLRAQWNPRYPFPTIVVITAGVRNEQLAELDVQHVIYKPFHVRDLLDILRTLTH